MNGSSAPAVAEERQRSRHALPWPMIGATVAMLAVAFALQLVTLGHGAGTAISDLPRVLLHRGIGPGSLPYIDRAIEYPAGSGILLYLATLIAPGPLGALAITALAATVLCALITVALERRFGPRAWRWAIGAPVFLYAFQNWDVFAVAALLAGFFAYEQRKDGWSGLMIGLGAAVKLFPAVVLPPLVALRFARGDRRGALRLTAGAVGGFTALNLPFLVARPSGWWWPYAFQSHRQATWGSAWFYVFRVVGLPVHGATGAHLANSVSFVALVVGVTWLRGSRSFSSATRCTRRPTTSGSSRASCCCPSRGACGSRSARQTPACS
jgi:hypothetical protein